MFGLTKETVEKFISVPKKYQKYYPIGSEVARPKKPSYFGFPTPNLTKEPTHEVCGYEGDYILLCPLTFGPIEKIHYEKLA